MEGKRTRLGLVLAMALALVLLVAACGEEKDEEPAGDGGGGGSASAKDCGKVTHQRERVGRLDGQRLHRQDVLEDDLGCEVEITKIAEIPAFQAMADGKVDAVLEDWEHADEDKKYVDEGGHRRRRRPARRRRATSAGSSRST